MPHTIQEITPNISGVFQTFNLIIDLEKKMTSRFDGLAKRLLHYKDVIINLQIESQSKK